LKRYDQELTSTSSNLVAYCSRVHCDKVVPAAVKTIDRMEADIKDIEKALSQAQTSLCPSAACINLDLLWFLNETGCVCDPDAIAATGTQAKEGALLCSSHDLNTTWMNAHWIAYSICMTSIA
jgi:hypothetical protein